MNRSEVIQTLQTERAALQAMGVASLALFGSVARDEATEESDIDLLATYNKDARVSLFDVMHIESYLADLFHRPVQITSEPIKKPRLLKNITRDRHDIF
jgi:predicted nucleotidyltransferase